MVENSPETVLLQRIAEFLLAGPLSSARKHECLMDVDADGARTDVNASGIYRPKLAGTGDEAKRVGARSVPVIVNGMEFFQALPDLYPLLGNWGYLWELLQHAARQVFTQRSVSNQDVAPPCDERERDSTPVRLAHIPGAEFARKSLAELRVSDVGHFVRVTGTVTRAGAVKVIQEWRDFKCDQCGVCFRRRASPAANYDFEMPKQCTSGEKRTAYDVRAKRPKTMKCHSKQFSPLPRKDDCMGDFQEVRIQDHMEALGVGVVPKSAAVVLIGDLVSQVQPGDSVLVEGVTMQRWKPTFPGKRAEIELFIEATHVERIGDNSPLKSFRIDLHMTGRDAFSKLWADTMAQNGDMWMMRARLIRATAPWLSGLPVPKLALLLTLIGGAPTAGARDTSSNQHVLNGPEGRWDRFRDTASSPAKGGSCAEVAPSTENRTSASGADINSGRNGRTTPHLLLLGDPGTGKSQLLQAAQELAGRSIRTTGLGCTNAGLTCAAIRDGPDFVLEAGALVLADGGVCCVDEFSMIRNHDRAAVHEAMEQQTVSVAKAGLVMKLRSECSVIAAQNCRRARAGGTGYDCGATVGVNSGLPPPLLSRFDLVVVFANQAGQAEAEAERADFIIDAANPNVTSCGAATPKTATLPDGVDHAGACGETDIEHWGHDKLREYIEWVKQNSLPQGADLAAHQILAAYFSRLRSSAPVDASTCKGGVTVRTFESLLRLAQAHARLMCHAGVQRQDAVAAVVLHRAALQDHVVGVEASEGPETANDNNDDTTFEPSLRDRDRLGETPVCSLPLSFGLSLTHGVDISDQATYERLERAVLQGLGLVLRPDGSVEERPMLQLPAPEQERSSVVAAPETSQVRASQMSEAYGALSQQSAQPQPKRFRRLGFRPR